MSSYNHSDKDEILTPNECTLTQTPSQHISVEDVNNVSNQIPWITILVCSIVHTLCGVTFFVVNILLNLQECQLCISQMALWVGLYYIVCAVFGFLIIASKKKNIVEHAILTNADTQTANEFCDTSCFCAPRKYVIVLYILNIISCALFIPVLIFFFIDFMGSVFECYPCEEGCDPDYCDPYYYGGMLNAFCCLVLILAFVFSIPVCVMSGRYLGHCYRCCNRFCCCIGCACPGLQKKQVDICLNNEI